MRTKDTAALEWWERMILSAQDNIREGQGVVPVFFIRVRGEFQILPLGEMIENKDLTAAFLKAVIAKCDPDEYLLIFESWMKLSQGADEGERALGRLVQAGALAVSQLPSRKECLFIVHGRRSSERRGLILFEGRGASTKFQPIVWDTGLEAGGRFCNLRGSR